MIGVVFFGLTAVMVKRENAVFLSHKAGMNLHTVTDEEIQDKFMAMIYTMIVSTIEEEDVNILKSLHQKARIYLISNRLL